MTGRHAQRRDSKSYQVVYETKFGKYSLNGVDASLEPGPKRPFNFFGQFNEVRGVFEQGGRGTCLTIRDRDCLTRRAREVFDHVYVGCH